MNIHGNKDSVVREFAAALLDEPLWDGGRAEDDMMMATGTVPILGVKVDRNADFQNGAAGMLDPDANEAGWWLKHKDYAGKVPAGDGRSALPTE